MKIWIRNGKYRVMFDNMATREIDRFGHVFPWTPEDGFEYGRFLSGGLDDVPEIIREAIEGVEPRVRMGEVA